LRGACHVRYGSLSDSLWGAFANPEYSPPQEPEQIWANREGLHRIDPMRVEWHEVKANKDHICTRGLRHQAERSVFQVAKRAGWDGELKVCAGCLAMILYFKQVHELPPYMKTHWDVVEQRPVRLDEATDK